MRYTTRSAEETVALGRRLGEHAKAGQCIALTGTLGAGKTQLARGIAQGARVEDAMLVSSPTYVILNIYNANRNDPRSKTVFHLDAYRTAGAEDFAAVGFDELLEEGGITVVEWPERIAKLLPADRLEIAIRVLDPATRDIELRALGTKSQFLVKAMGE